MSRILCYIVKIDGGSQPDHWVECHSNYPGAVAVVPASWLESAEAHAERGWDSAELLEKKVDAMVAARTKTRLEDAHDTDRATD